MSFMIYTDHNNRVFYQQVQGVYTAAELTEANIYIKSLDQQNDYRMLFDLSEMRLLDVTDSYLESIGNRMKTELPVRYRAIVTNPRFLEQMQVFARHAQTGFQNVQVFSSLSEACNWLLISEFDLLSNCAGDDWFHDAGTTGTAAAVA